MTARVLPFKRPYKEPMTTGSMRRLVYRICRACEHSWAQPSDTGSCPNCHGIDVLNTGEGRCEAPYRK